MASRSGCYVEAAVVGRSIPRRAWRSNRRRRRRRRRLHRPNPRSLAFQFRARTEYRWLSSAFSLYRPLFPFLRAPRSPLSLVSVSPPLLSLAEPLERLEPRLSTPNHPHPPLHSTRNPPRGTLSSTVPCYSYPLHDNDGNQTLRKDFRKFSRLFVGSRGGGGRRKHRSSSSSMSSSGLVIVASSFFLFSSWPLASLPLSRSLTRLRFLFRSLAKPASSIHVMRLNWRRASFP